MTSLLALPVCDDDDDAKALPGFVVMLIPATETSLDVLSSVLGQREDRREKPVGLCVKAQPLAAVQT